MFLYNLFKGIIIGIGFIIPGVSGGVLATILGIYDSIIYKINNLFKDFKNNILFLFPIFLGIIISILLFSKLILYLLDNQLYFISYVFIGLILGCIPFLIKEIKIKTNQNINLIAFLISFLFGIFLFMIENNNYSSFNNINLGTMVLAGIVYSIGKIVPGISGAALLMLLGVYEYFLSIISNPLSIDINTIIKFIPFLISFLVSSIVIIKLTYYLLCNHFRLTYSVIIGFVISSILFIYPGMFKISSLIISFCSFLISYSLMDK